VSHEGFPRWRCRWPRDSSWGSAISGWREAVSSLVDGRLFTLAQAAGMMVRLAGRHAPSSMAKGGPRSTRYGGQALGAIATYPQTFARQNIGNTNERRSSGSPRGMRTVAGCIHGGGVSCSDN
jgi:hypothetical protein